MADSSASRDRARSRSEHVFVVGNDIGQGTQGLGEEKCRAASTELHKNYMSNYWSRRAGQTGEQKKREAERLRKIQVAQAGSAKERLEIAMAKRARDIEEMTAERKAFERQFKEDQKKEREERNALIHAEKVLAKQQHDDATEQRRIEKERALVKLRKDRDELRRLRQLEGDAEKIIATEHYTKMRQIHDVWKARAEEEKRQRFEEKRHDVVEMNEKQQERVVEHKALVHEIVDIKASIAKTSTARAQQLKIRREHQRDMELEELGNTQRQGVKQRAEKRKLTIEEEREERKKEAKAKQLAAEQAHAEYIAAKEQRFEELRREAHEQKIIAQAEVEAEKEEQRQAHHEYIALMKELAARTAATKRDKMRDKMNGTKSPNADGQYENSQSVSPTRKGGARKHPQPMSPSKLESPARNKTKSVG